MKPDTGELIRRISSVTKHSSWDQFIRGGYEFSKAFQENQTQKNIYKFSTICDLGDVALNNAFVKEAFANADPDVKRKAATGLVYATYAGVGVVVLAIAYKAVIVILKNGYDGMQLPFKGSCI